MGRLALHLLPVAALVATLYGAALDASGDPAIRPFSRDAIHRAVAATVLQDRPVDTLSDWSRVERLASDRELTVAAAGQPALRGNLVSADAAGISVRRSGVVERIGRQEVVEIRAATGRRGSKLGAVIGAGVGGFVGFVTALNVALRDCGGNCSDEKFLVGLSLVGSPVAGGVLGYYAGGPRTEVVYRQP